LSFEIPRRGLGGLGWFSILMGAGTLAVVALLWIHGASDVETPPGRKWLFGILMAVLVVVPLLLVLVMLPISNAVARVRVDVSPRELRVTRKSLFGTSVTAIPADALEELELASEEGDAAILARSDQASVTFGEGLYEDELAWMAAVIKTVVTA
jgi:hypothetical protein